ncbi:hypothetical protein LTR66_007386 [Elasticomyces elasticus]|nr:hypothetical protein LTR66_007386 [Elasticomyces elasticus]
MRCHLCNARPGCVPQCSTLLHSDGRHILTVKTLQQHEATSAGPDNHYAEGLIREEQVHGYYLELDNATSNGLSPEQLQEALSCSSLRLHRLPQPSLATPMERYMTMGLANDPNVWYARAEMVDTGLTVGAMDTAEVRTVLAQTLARTEGDTPNDAESLRSLPLTANDGGERYPETKKLRQRKRHRKADAESGRRQRRRGEAN